MNRTATIATIGIIHVGKMFALAVAIFAGFEAVNWGKMTWDSWREGNG